MTEWIITPQVEAMTDQLNSNLEDARRSCRRFLAAWEGDDWEEQGLATYDLEATVASLTGLLLDLKKVVKEA